MAMTITLKPKATSLTIGDDYVKTNALEFTIELTGDEPVWLTLTMPLGATGVLYRSEDGNDLTLESPGNPHFPCVPAYSDDSNVKVWSLGDPQKGVQVTGSYNISVTISNVLCRANEGGSEITVVGQVGSSTADIITRLPITKAKPKTAPENPICYFTAEPTFVIGEGPVTLRWDVVGAQTATLQTPSGQTVSPDKSEFKETITRTGAYTLTVDGKQRQATVNVLTEGWHQLYPLGSRAFPSVIFDSGGRCDDAIYAIFVRAEERRGRQAVLCKSADGITGWHIVNDAVPDGMESSPGLRFGNRLWLIGGSAVQWHQKSKRICHYDLEHPAKGWRDAMVTGNGGFEERMGHACVVVDDRSLWVMGGLGPYACVKDLWKFEIDTADRGKLHGTELKASSDWWRPRCLFSAVNVDGMIWVGGGVSSPNGNALGDLWATPSSAPSWKPRPKGKLEYVVANAIGTGMACCDTTLFTVVTNRTGGPSWQVEQMMWAAEKKYITTTSDAWNKSSAPSLREGWPSTPHSISLVGFRTRLYLRALHKTAMSGEVVGAPLLVYVRTVRTT